MVSLLTYMHTLLFLYFYFLVFVKSKKSDIPPPVPPVMYCVVASRTALKVTCPIRNREAACPLRFWGETSMNWIRRMYRKLERHTTPLCHGASTAEGFRVCSESDWNLPIAVLTFVHMNYNTKEISILIKPSMHKCNLEGFKSFVLQC